MKKILISISAIFAVISCSKNLDNNITYEADTKFESVNVTNSKFESVNISNTLIIDLNKDDSLDKVHIEKYLIDAPFTSHEKDSIAKIMSESEMTIDGIITGEDPEYSDYSGRIHLKKFWSKTTYELNLQQNITASVTSDYALVGGGARTCDFNPATENGAFLYRSSPKPGDNTSWIASSKAHMTACLHNLYVYAIGMRIDSVDPAYLRSKVKVFTSLPSAPSDFPQQSKSVDYGYLLTGGGAYITWHSYGNMLIRSYPNYLTWWVKGKAHRRHDASEITAYAIGIQDISYPGVGYLRVIVNPQIEYAGYGEAYCESDCVEGTALTCPGGIVTYNGIGRMLEGLYPQDYDPCAFLISNDSDYDDDGYNQAFAVGIEKRPW